MRALTILTILALTFLVSAALLVAFQNRICRSIPAPSAPANIRRCLWAAFVSGVWLPWFVLNQWNSPGAMSEVWASLEDQRLFLAGMVPTIWPVALASVVQPWAHSIRSWLLGANLLAFGLFYGLFVGTAAWPGNLVTYQFLFWPALGFGLTIWRVLHSTPGQTWSDNPTTSGIPASNTVSGS